MLLLYTIILSRDFPFSMFSNKYTFLRHGTHEDITNSGQIQTFFPSNTMFYGSKTDLVMVIWSTVLPWENLWRNKAKKLNVTNHSELLAQTYG